MAGEAQDGRSNDERDVPPPVDAVALVIKYFKIW